MGKLYVVDGAILCCTLGTSTATLKVPKHRHIKIAGKLMANCSDVNLGQQCIGSFGNCYRSSPPPPCIYTITIPWQSIKDDVFAAKHEGVLENSWTMCNCGGRVSIIEPGQGMSETEMFMKFLQELQKCAIEFAAEEASSEKINELVYATILWSGYEQMPWEVSTSEYKMMFHEYLQKENPGLFYFFDRRIELDDPLGNGKVDISYLAGAMSMEKEKSDQYFFQLPKEAIENPAQMTGYVDAYLIEQQFKGKEILPSEVFEQYYGFGDCEEAPIVAQKGRYENLCSDKELLTTRFYGKEAMTYSYGAALHFALPGIMEDAEEGNVPFEKSEEAYLYNVTDENIELVKKAIQQNYEEEKKRKVVAAIKSKRK